MESDLVVVQPEEPKRKLTYNDKLKCVSVIAKPMASEQLSKKIYRLIKRASRQKNFLRSGLKDVQKGLRKGEIGIVILAGNVTPIDIMSHLPAVCEEKNIAYCYIPTQKDIGGAMGVKRGSLMVLIHEHEAYKELFEECQEEIKTLSVVL